MGIKEPRELEATAGGWGAGLGWGPWDEDAPSWSQEHTEPAPYLSGTLVGLWGQTWRPDWAF